jgi:hypothetical protein
MLRGTFRLKWDVDWRKLCYEKVHNLYSSSNIISVIKLRRKRWAGHIAHMEESKTEPRGLVRKPGIKTSLERTGSTCEYIIKMDLRNTVS